MDGGTLQIFFMSRVAEKGNVSFENKRFANLYDRRGDAGSKPVTRRPLRHVKFHLPSHYNIVHSERHEGFRSKAE